MGWPCDNTFFVQTNATLPAWSEAPKPVTKVCKRVGVGSKHRNRSIQQPRKSRKACVQPWLTRPSFFFHQLCGRAGLLNEILTQGARLCSPYSRRERCAEHVCGGGSKTEKKGPPEGEPVSTTCRRFGHRERGRGAPQLYSHPAHLHTRNFSRTIPVVG